jgi:hypothetical protein
MIKTNKIMSSALSLYRRSFEKLLPDNMNGPNYATTGATTAPKNRNGDDIGVSPQGNLGPVHNWWRGDVIILATALTPLVFCIIQFAIFLSIHRDKMYSSGGANVKQIPTISRSGAFRPESIFFTLSTHIEAFLLLLALNCIYHIYERKCQLHVNTTYFQEIQQDESSFRRGMSWFFLSSNVEAVRFWNKFAYCLGVFSCLCLLVVGSVSSGYYAMVHTTFAYLVFLSAVLLTFILHLKVCRPFMTNNYEQVWLTRLQYYCFTLLIVVCVALLIISAIIAATCNNNYCRFYNEDVDTILEYVTAVALLLFILSFYYEMKAVSVSTVLQDAGVTELDRSVRSSMV